MGEGDSEALHVEFDGRIRLEFHGAKVVIDTDLLACRELDEALALIASVDEIGMIDPRTGQNTRHTPEGM